MIKKLIFFLLTLSLTCATAGGQNVGGAASDGSLNFAGNVTFPVDILAETKPIYGATNNTFGKGVSVVNNATQTLVNLTGQSGGYVTYFFLGWNASETTSTMVITADGNTVFSDRACLFFGAEYQNGNASFMTRYFGASNNNSNNVGFYSYIPIPFSSSLSITFTNKSGGTHALYWTIGYQNGVPDNWPRTRHLVTSTGTIAGITPYTVETLVNASSLNRGRLFGITMSIDSVPGSASPLTGPLEGEFKIYLDGNISPNWTSSGTEDYFGMSDYFQGFGLTPVTSTLNAVSNGLSAYAGATIIRTTGTWNAYRFHILDPIVFSNALKMTWDAGESSFITWTGTVRIAYCLYYYTE